MFKGVVIGACVAAAALPASASAATILFNAYSHVEKSGYKSATGSLTTPVASGPVALADVTAFNLHFEYSSDGVDPMAPSADWGLSDLLSVGGTVDQITFETGASANGFTAKKLPTVFVFDWDGVFFTNIAANGSPAVPEPATWAMMIVGFGLMGAALRRRGSGAVAAIGVA